MAYRHELIVRRLVMWIFPITICMSPCNVIVLVQRDTDMTLQSVLDPDGAETRKSRRLKRKVHKNKVGVTKKYRSSLLLPLPILCRETRKSRRLKRRVYKNKVGVTEIQIITFATFANPVQGPNYV